MTWRRVSLVVTVVFSLAVPARATAAPGEGSLSPVVPQPWHQEGPTAFERLAEARGARLERDAFERIRLDLLRMEAPAAVIADPEFVFPARAGDLDGDGKDDLLTFEFAAEAATLRARSGIDGGELWSLPGAYVGLPADLDGDGTTEVITVRSERTTIQPGVDATLQHVALMNGDGAEIWSYVVPGAVVRLNDQQRGQAADVEFVASVRAIPDATADGAPDVWVGTLNAAQAYDDGYFVQADAFDGHTVDGATGLEAGRVLAASRDGMSWVVPAADVSGDGLADTFSMSGLTTDAGVVAARTAQGVPLWVAQVPTNFAYPSVHDLDGDGRPDVLVQAFVDGFVHRLAFSGAGGAALWARPDNGYVDKAGDIDGDGGTDLIQIVAVDNTITASAWSGTTGTDLWGPVSYAGPVGAWALNCICTDDLTGDGVWDPLTATVVFSDPPVVTVTTLDGSDGSTLWSADVPPSFSFPVPIGADVDGDGAADVGNASADGATVVLRTMRGTDGTEIWATSAPMDGFPLGFYGDDVAGGDEPELVLAGVRFVDESIRGFAQAYDPGGQLWSVP